MTYQELGACVREARLGKNVTQMQLAERTNIAQADISRMENGNSNPTIATLKRIASGLDMRVTIAFVDTPNDQGELQK